jgi:AcrR family transcriptional regulator
MAGRPRSFDRDAALAVAVEQFWRHGYEETSIASLTAAMGVTPPSLYALPSTREAIARVLSDTARAHTDPATPAGCLMLTEPRLEAQRAVLRQRLQDRLDQGVRDHDLAGTTNTDHLASFLVAVLRGMSGCARDGGTTEDLLGIAENAMVALPAPTSARMRS